MNRKVAIIVAGLAWLVAAPATAEHVFGNQPYKHSGAPHAELEAHEVHHKKGVSRRHRFIKQGKRHGGASHSVGVKRLGFPYGSPNPYGHGFQKVYSKPLGFPYGRRQSSGLNATFGQGGVKATLGNGKHQEQGKFPLNRKHRRFQNKARNKGYFRHPSRHNPRFSRFRHTPTQVIYHQHPVVERVVVVSPQAIQQPTSVEVPVTTQSREPQKPVKFVHINSGNLDPSALLNGGIQEASSQDILGVDLQLTDGPMN